VRELIGEAQTPLQTYLVMPILVSKLIPYSTRPRQGTDSL